MHAVYFFHRQLLRVVFYKRLCSWFFLQQARVRRWDDSWRRTRCSSYTQARALLFRVERLPHLLSITSTVDRLLACPSPASTIANSICLHSANQRLDRIIFRLADRLASTALMAANKNALKIHANRLGKGDVGKGDLRLSIISDDVATQPRGAPGQMPRIAELLQRARIARDPDLFI